jgi:hypothetical protein
LVRKRTAERPLGARSLVHKKALAFGFIHPGKRYPYNGIPALDPVKTRQKMPFKNAFYL